MFIRLLLSVFSLLWSPPQVRIPGPGGASPSATAPAYINGGCAGGNGAQTASINMTGANLYVLTVVGGTPTYTFSDTNSSSWSALQGSSGLLFSYAANVTGAPDKFTLTAGGFPGFCVAGFSGMYTSSVYESGTYVLNISPGTTTCQPGSTTPATAGHQVFIAGLQFNNSPVISVNAPFSTPPLQVNNLGGNYGNATSYYIQAGGGAQNSTFNYAGGTAVQGCWQAVFQGN